MTESVPPVTDRILDLDRQGSSPQHVLDGRPVQADTVIEVQLANGGWLPLRYEARWVEYDGEGRAGLFSRWHLEVATGESQAEVELHDLQSGTVLRWPEP